MLNTKEITFVGLLPKKVDNTANSINNNDSDCNNGPCGFCLRHMEPPSNSPDEEESIFFSLKNSIVL